MNVSSNPAETLMSEFRGAGLRFRSEEPDQRREDVADFSCSNSEGEGAECPMSARMAIATDNCFARLCCAEFGSDYVDNSAVSAVEPM